MPDIFDQLLNEGKPQASIPSEEPAFHNPSSTANGDIFDLLLAQPEAPQSASGSPDTGEAPSWWAEHGKTVEQAAAAGLALAFAPFGLKMAGKLAEHSGVLGTGTQRGAKAVQSILAPATVDAPAQDAAALIRERGGVAAQEVAKTRAKLEPEWSKIGGADDIDKLQFIKYVEGRSKGAVLANPELQKLADEMKQAHAEVHQAMGNLAPTQKSGFIEDYYRHHWVVDDKYDRAFSKQGMNSFIKQRTIPTIQEGIDKGLTPKSLDPVQTTLGYVENARRFIASNEILNRARQTGQVVARTIGNRKPFPTTYDNWVPLEGSLAKRTPMQLYAPEGFARVYNNWVSPGFTGAAGDVVNAARRTSNAITGLELGLSGFHATTMVNEAIVNDVAKAIQEAAGGRIGDALTSLIKAPAAPVRLYRLGKNIEKTYLGTQPATQSMRQITDLLAKAGGRASGMSHAKDYEYTAAGSFFDSFKRGSLKAEAIEKATGIKNSPVLGTIKAVGNVVGKTLQTVAHPLFKVYIPRLKNGAFYDNMASWLKANPTASPEMQLKAARQIWDSIDNRFGELVQDNIFWKQHMKQMAMLGMRSYSWTMGSVREIGGGVKDMSMHKFTPRAAYAIALPIVYGTLGAIYQKLKTGEDPKDVHDLLSPRTGGTDPATGLPERMIMPGYIKDVIGWTDHPTDELINKLSTGVRLPIDIARNKDWRGAPIHGPVDSNQPWEQSAPGWLKAYFDYVTQAMTPISVRDLSKGGKRGTNITPLEQGMGMKPAGRSHVDPEGSEALKQYFDTKAWNKKLQYDERQKSMYDNYGGVE